MSDKRTKCDKSMWVCLCDCGAEKVVSIDSLVSGSTQSCGCEVFSWYRFIDLNKDLVRLVSPKGYIRIRVGRTYVLEHRMVMEQHLNRKLTFNETIHHINGTKSDNRLENLEIINRSEHSCYHTTKRHLKSNAPKK